MTPEELYKDAIGAKKQGAFGITLVFRNGQKKPRGFPRGELLCESVDSKVYSFSPDKVIKWLEKNKLIGERVCGAEGKQT